MNSLQFISFLFFDGVVEISPFNTLRIDKSTNVETFFAFFVITSSLLSKPDLCLPTHFTRRKLLLAFITLRDTHSHSVWLLWTRDRPVTEPSTWQHDIHKRQTSCLRRDSNPQSQQTCDRKPTPQSARPPDTAFVVTAQKNVTGNVFKITTDTASRKMISDCECNRFRRSCNTTQ